MPVSVRLDRKGIQDKQMILLDTGPIVAFFDASEKYQNLCLDVLKKIKGPLITTWPVLTEAFYLLGFSWRAQDKLWEFIMRGGLEMAPRCSDPDKSKRYSHTRLPKLSKRACPPGGQGSPPATSGLVNPF